MPLIRLLTRFDGRIPRRDFWLGIAIVIIVFGAGRYFLKQALGLETPGPDGPVVTLWSMLAVVPLTALLVKRLGDRSRPAWLGYAQGAITALTIAAPAFGLLTDPAGLSLGESIVLWATLPLSLFVWFEAGFRPGIASA